MINKSIGKRITIAEHKDATTVVIDASIPASSQIALEAWFGGWLGLGGLIGYELILHKETSVLCCWFAWLFGRSSSFAFSRLYFGGEWAEKLSE